MSTWSRCWRRAAGCRQSSRSLKTLSDYLYNLGTRDRLPAFNTDHVNLEALLTEGRRLRAEQEAVGSQRLAKEYMNDTGFRGQSMIGLGG